MPSFAGQCECWSKFNGKTLVSAVQRRDGWEANSYEATVMVQMDYDDGLGRKR